jgi:hypothetical protein
MMIMNENNDNSGENVKDLVPEKAPVLNETVTETKENKVTAPQEPESKQNITEGDKSDKTSDEQKPNGDKSNGDKSNGDKSNGDKSANPKFSGKPQNSERNSKQSGEQRTQNRHQRPKYHLL